MAVWVAACTKCQGERGPQVSPGTSRKWTWHLHPDPPGLRQVIRPWSLSLPPATGKEVEVVNKSLFSPVEGKGGAAQHAKVQALGTVAARTHPGFSSEGPSLSQPLQRDLRSLQVPPTPTAVPRLGLGLRPSLLGEPASDLSWVSAHVGHAPLVANDKSPTSPGFS